MTATISIALMKIICISDTHIGRGDKHLPRALLEALENADLILHAGDITSMEVIDELKAYGHVEAVAGNMDGWYVSRHLPEKKIIEAGKFRIGLTHGGGNKLNLEERVVQKFINDKVDCLVYGHSHRAQHRKTRRHPARQPR